MICKVCQTDGHLQMSNKYIYDACDKCTERIMDDKSHYGFTQLNKEMEVLWHHSADIDGNPFSIFFKYNHGTTVFVRDNKEVLILEGVKPLTSKFLNEAREKIKLWQVFS